MSPDLAGWTADRLNKLDRLVDADNSRLDQMEEIVKAHERDLKNIAATGDRRADRSWALKLLLASTTFTMLGNIAVQLLHH